MHTSPQFDSCHLALGRNPSEHGCTVRLCPQKSAVFLQTLDLPAITTPCRDDKCVRFLCECWEKQNAISRHP